MSVVHSPVLLGLGANVGDAMTQLAAAVELIGDLDGVTVEEVSSVYATPPWPPPDDPRHVPQDDYLNLVVRARADIGPETLLAATLELEGLLGRDRTDEQRWGPRPIDIDLLVHGDELRDLPELTVPHPRITQRAFVVVPLLVRCWAPLPAEVSTASEVEALTPIRLAAVPRSPAVRVSEIAPPRRSSVPSVSLKDAAPLSVIAPVPALRSSAVKPLASLRN